jgi:cell division protein FtsL
MSRPQTDTPAASTVRVRLHRARRQAVTEFEKLIYTTIDTTIMFNAVELLESELLCAQAYPTPKTVH